MVQDTVPTGLPPEVYTAHEQRQIDEQRRTARESAFALIDGIGSVVIGLPHVIRRVVMGLLADGQVKPGKAVCGHILLEAVPGTAKTLLSETLALSLRLSFSRIQMDVDKRPADILGYYDTDVEQQALTFRPGPIFANIVLIDEFNRARPEVKGALLQAMAEREVSIDTQTYALDAPFFIIANQNPSDQEGTYPLIEAELDRFIAKLHLGYLSRQDEIAMLRRVANFARSRREPPTCLEGIQIENLRQFIREHTYIEDRVIQYAVDLVRATRPEDPLHAACLQDFMIDGRSIVQLGASPRATLFLLNFARVEAFLSGPPDRSGRSYVMPADIAAVAYDVLNHRLILHDLLVHTILNHHPLPYLDPALRAAGQRVLSHRDDLVEQILRRLLRYIPLP